MGPAEPAPAVYQPVSYGIEMVCIWAALEPLDNLIQRLTVFQ